jgi:hypothetical protein
LKVGKPIGRSALQQLILRPNRAAIIIEEKIYSPGADKNRSEESGCAGFDAGDSNCDDSTLPSTRDLALCLFLRQNPAPLKKRPRYIWQGVHLRALYLHEPICRFLTNSAPCNC